MGKSSREKGKRGEREFATALVKRGFDGARRGQQYRGGEHSADVVCAELSPLHFEVKRTEALRLWEALEQAERDAGQGEIPVVAHRANDRPWVVILKLDDLLTLADLMGWFPK